LTEPEEFELFDMEVVGVEAHPETGSPDVVILGD